MLCHLSKRIVILSSSEFSVTNILFPSLAVLGITCLATSYHVPSGFGRYMAELGRCHGEVLKNIVLHRNRRNVAKADLSSLGWLGHSRLLFALHSPVSVPFRMK